MPNNVKKQWTLTVAPNQGGTLPVQVQALNNGKLKVFGQHSGPNAADTFSILTIKLTNGVNSDFQLAAGAIDASNNMGFIFLSNGTDNGTQYFFRAGQQNGNSITGGVISAPATSAGDEDIGSWSATSGGGGEDDEDYN